MRHRLVIAGVALAFAVSSVPLYRMVRQEFIPSGVDEAEFEVGITAPEGTSVAAMNEVAIGARKGDPQPADGDAGAVDGRRHVPVGGEPGRDVRAHRAARGTRVQLGAAGQGHRHAQSAAPRSAATTRRARSCRWSARGRGSSRDLRVQVRNIPSFNFAGGRTDLDLALRGPDLKALADYGEQLRLKAPELGHRRRRHHAEVEQAGAAGGDRSRARRRSRGRHPGHRHGAAPDGRRRRSRDALPRRRRQRRLRRAAAPDRRRPQRPRHDLAPARAAAERRAGAARQPREDRRARSAVAHRSHGPPAPGQPPRQRRRRLRAGGSPCRRCRRGRRR